MPPSWVRPTLVALAVGLAAVLLAPTAAACPLCDGGAGVNRSREAIFGADFTLNLAAAAAPFAVLGGVSAAVHFAPRRSAR